MMSNNIPSSRARLFYIIFRIMTGIIIVGAVIDTIEICIPETYRGEWHFWFQLFTGNWSTPPSSFSGHPFATSLSMLLSLTLNLASFGLFGLLLRRIDMINKTKERSIVAFNAMRDEAIISAFEKFIGEEESLSKDQKQQIEKILVRAIVEGDREFLEKYFKAAFREDAAAKKAAYMQFRA